jgi:hypothetical protein
MLTKNYGDSEILHKSVAASGGHHPGILLIREENERKRDIKPHQIVRAIVKLGSTAQSLMDPCVIVNHWR